MNKLWYVVYTYPQYEKRIVEKLSEKTIDAYLPTQSTVRQWSDRKKILDLPLFPNYVFVNVAPGERHKVLGIMGVTRFISFDGKPAVVSDKEINYIKILTGTKMEMVPESFWTVGDKVKIISGPLIGLEGMLIQKRGKQRFFLRFNSFEKAISVEINTVHLEKLSVSA